MSTRTAPGFILDTSSALTRWGAFAPGTRTAPTTRSASRTRRSIPRLDDIAVWIRPCHTWSIWRSGSTLRSTIDTSASMPAAICAALEPAMPAPSTTTRAGATPDAPPISTPRPTLGRSSRREVVVGDRGPLAGTVLYDHPVSGVSELTAPFRRGRHTELAVLDLGRDPDDHVPALPVKRFPGKPTRPRDGGRPPPSCGQPAPRGQQQSHRGLGVANLAAAGRGHDSIERPPHQP